ncbi:F-box domain-containing protein [Arthroderma uncinatum]|uniref:F-box domain-containing protein n=1 Tax=Arthroderma uncinatum TaxID=74035 RepID=UPI00144AD122|nr:F-box domain-containing protein [Arthroderma uncinatum]KAF3483894.1 F-box domain-containing protein [Arthroderma uncinatum]
MEGNHVSVPARDVDGMQSSEHMALDQRNAKDDSLSSCSDSGEPAKVLNTHGGGSAKEESTAAFSRLPEAIIESQASTHESDSIEDLKCKFAQVARQHVFAAFLRPKQTVVKLISASVSSSSASPQGEALRFTFSAQGRLLLALSSSRIFVIDLATDPISVRHELKILRRPTAAAILDDGTLLAVASSEHRVRVYRLDDQHASLLQTVELHEVPLTLEFSPYASVLTVAFDGGIEVYALGDNILSTSHRAVRCDGVSTLAFSSDGSLLFGSSTDIRACSLITISPPLLPDPGFDLSLPELHSRMWTTQILFPEIGEGYSCANLIPPAEGGDQSIFFVGYDTQMKAFRIAQVDDLAGGTLYLVGPGADTDRDEPGPNLLPVASEKGEYIAASFNGSGIWIYGVPTSRTKPENPKKTCQTYPQPTIPRADKNGSLSSEATNFQRLNKHIEGPKSFISGHPLEAVNDITDMRWMRNINGEDSSPKKLCRLVTVAPGGVDSSFGMITGDTMPIDGGRIILFDFELSTKNGAHEELIIEAGEATPTELPEQYANLDTEVELQKRRTQISRQRTMAARHAPPRATRRNSIPPAVSQQNEDSPSPPIPSTPGGETRSALPFLDSPYSNTSPRSTETLRRAATAASRSLAASRFENARPALHSGPRRRQFVVPHESDADNWVPPPPPYTADADDSLPDHFRVGIVPRATEPLPSSPPRDEDNRVLRRSRTSTIDSTGSSSLYRSQTTISRPSISIPRRPVATSSATNSPVNHPNNTQTTAMSPSNPIANGRRQLSSSQIGFNTANSGSFLPPHTPATTNITPIPHFPPQVPPMQPPMNSTHANSTPMAGHNVPSHHTTHDPMNQAHSHNMNMSTSMPNQLQPSGPGSQTMQPDPFQRPSYIPSPVASNSQAADFQGPLPGVPTLPIERQISGTNSLPEAAHRNTLPRGSRCLSTNYRPTVNTNVGVERSRSRSQDVPRRRILPNAGGGLFDKRTGRNILTSQSDIRINTTTRSEDWKEQWNKLKGERKKNKDSKCVVM